MKTVSRLIGWQGFTVFVPDDWDLTGFSGDYDNGYFRVDNGEEMGLEVKWGTESGKNKGRAGRDRAPGVLSAQSAENGEEEKTGF